MKKQQLWATEKSTKLWGTKGVGIFLLSEYVMVDAMGDSVLGWLVLLVCVCVCVWLNISFMRIHIPKFDLAQL